MSRVISKGGNATVAGRYVAESGHWPRTRAAGRSRRPPWSTDRAPRVRFCSAAAGAGMQLRRRASSYWASHDWTESFGWLVSELTRALRSVNSTDAAI